MKKLSIIITNYNRKDYLNSCMESIYSFIPDNLDYEIIIVDDSSNDGSVDSIRDRYVNKITNIKIVVNKDNLGYISSLNIGINLSAGEFLLILDSDTELIEEIFTPMMQSFDQNPRLGAVGVNQIDSSNNKQGSSGPIPNIFSFIMGQTLSSRLYSSKYKLKENIIEALYSSCIMTKRSIINDIGMFDERFYLLEGDTEFCYRLVKNNLDLRILDDYKIIHKSNSGHSDSRRVVEFHKANMKFFEKYESKHTIVFLKLLLLLRHSIEISYFFIKYKISKNKKTFYEKYNCRIILLNTVFNSYQEYKSSN